MKAHLSHSAASQSRGSSAAKDHLFPGDINGRMYRDLPQIRLISSDRPFTVRSPCVFAFCQSQNLFISGGSSFVTGRRSGGEDTSAQSCQQWSTSLMVLLAGHFCPVSKLTESHGRKQIQRPQHYCHETTTQPEELMETISFYCYIDFYKMCYSLKYFRTFFFHIIDLCEIS